MIRVFGFLFWRSLVNRTLRRFSRLREVRYLVPALVGLGYIVYMGSQVFGKGMPGRAIGVGGVLGDEVQQGLVFIGSLFVVVMNLVADVIYAITDPRIRY